MSGSKLTNKNQMRILVDAMKANKDIARGTRLKNSADILAFWCGIKLKLNEHGPPLKLLSGWKKVWSDYKVKIRKKIIRSLSSDWDPCKAVPLSALEEEVNQLLGIESTLLKELKDSSIVLPTYDSEDDNIAATDSSSEDVYSLDNFDKQTENSTEVAVEAVRLYDLQIDLLKKELQDWESFDKKEIDVLRSNSNTISSPPSPIADTTLMKTEIEDVEIACSSANISNNANSQSDNKMLIKIPLKRRILNTNALSKKKKVAIEGVNDYGERIKSEIIDESEIDLEVYDVVKFPTNNGIFIIDTAIPPLAPLPTPPTLAINTGVSTLPPLAPAPNPPTLSKVSRYTPAALPPALQSPPNLVKRKFDASTNTDLPENHSNINESILINISNDLQEIREINNNFMYYLEKLCATEEKKVSIMQDANNEQKRHNQQMEKYSRISF